MTSTDVSVVEVIQADREAAMASWNAIADEHNQWHMLSLEEQISWQLAFARHRIAAARTTPETTRVMVEALKKIAAKSDRHVKGVAHAEDMLDAIGDIARAALSLHRSKTHDQ